MGTLVTNEFNYSADFDIIEKQYRASKEKKMITDEEYRSAVTLFKEGNSYFDRRNLPNAYEYFNRVFKLVEGKDLPDLEAACLYYLSMFLLIFSDEEKAMQGFSAAFSISKDNYLKLSILNRMAVHYLTNYNLQRVLDITNLSLALTEKLEKTKQIKYYIAASNYSRSEAYTRNEDYNAALPFVHTASQQFNTIGLKLETSKCNSLLGTIYTSTGKYNEALPFLQDAIKVFKNHGDNDEMASLLMNIGLCYLALGKKEEGHAKLKDALQYAQKTGNAEMLNSLLAAIASQENN